MPNIDAKASEGCKILPFSPKDISSSKVQTTSLAALIAVTILHDADISAEEKLMEIIERSGEAEILDADEAYADLGLGDIGLDDPGVEEMDISTGKTIPEASNDNAIFETL